MTQYGRTNERDNTTEVVHHKVERERHRTLLHSHIHTLQYHTYIHTSKRDMHRRTIHNIQSVSQIVFINHNHLLSLSLSQPLTLTSTSPTPGTIVVLTALSSSASVRTSWVVNAVSLLAADLVVSEIFNATNIV